MMYCTSPTFVYLILSNVCTGLTFVSLRFVPYNICTTRSKKRYTLTAHKLSLHYMLHFYKRFLTSISQPLVAFNTHSGFTIFKKILQLTRFLNLVNFWRFCFHIPEYRCLVFGHVHQLYKIETVWKISNFLAFNKSLYSLLY